MIFGCSWKFRLRWGLGLEDGPPTEGEPDGTWKDAASELLGDSAIDTSSGSSRDGEQLASSINGQRNRNFLHKDSGLFIEGQVHQ